MNEHQGRLCPASAGLEKGVATAMGEITLYRQEVRSLYTVARVLFIIYLL